MKKVCVILATYNAEKYLQTQLDSIFAQKDVEVFVHVTDDGSTDGTLDIIKNYQKTHSNISVHINSKNKNFTYNFLDALFRFKDENKFDFYAFADQDDYWLPTKLVSAVKKIEETGNCTLYCSNLKIVDENLNYNNRDMLSKKFINKHYDAICKNFVTGCTVVMDNEFKNLATKFYPENIYLHDYWLALIANYCQGANFVYDNNAYILYRQHGNNQIGEGKGLIKKAFKQKPKQKSTKRLCEEFYKLYGNIIKHQDKEIIEMLSNLNFKNRVKLFFKVKGNYSKIFKVKMLLNKY